MGVYRGTSMINYCMVDENAEVVAIRDIWEKVPERHKEDNKELNI